MVYQERRGRESKSLFTPVYGQCLYGSFLYLESASIIQTLKALAHQNYSVKGLELYRTSSKSYLSKHCGPVERWKILKKRESDTSEKEKTRSVLGPARLPNHQDCTKNNLPCVCRQVKLCVAGLLSRHAWVEGEGVCVID